MSSGAHQPIQPPDVDPALLEVTSSPANRWKYETISGETAPVAQATESVPEDENEDEAGLAGSVLRAVPPWLISAVFHMVLLLILALIWLVNPGKQQQAILSLSDVVDAPTDLDTSGEVPLDMELPRDDLALVQELTPVNDPFAAPVVPKLEIPSPVEVTPAPQIAIALRGREDGSRQTMLERYGGTVESEAAVQRALAWLAKQQRANGSWSLRGPYSKGASNEDTVAAATAMALLAFQGNGNTHQRGQYQTQVQDGMNWLLEHQTEFGNFPVGNSHDQFYTQGLCTIAVCELFGMSEDSRLREPAERAVDFCVRTQAPSGGWRYNIVDGQSTESDLSVTGWVLMGLQSARMAGLEVPQQTLDNVTRLLDLNSADFNGTRYSYSGGDSADPVMTAEGLLCRQYLGWSHDDERLRDGVEYLISPRNLPRWNNADTNVYYWYYATQVTHHMEGRAWTKWNNEMRDLLVKHQTRTGDEAGSWEPDDDFWGRDGGRLYVTCLAVYTLEVYYRHMPLYSRIRLPR